MKKSLLILFSLFCLVTIVKAQGSPEFVRGVALGKADAKAMLGASGFMGTEFGSGPGDVGGPIHDDGGVVPVAPGGSGQGTLVFIWYSESSRDAYFEAVHGYILNCQDLAVQGIDSDFNNGKAEGMQLQSSILKL